MEILLTPEKWTLDMYPELIENPTEKKISNYVITAQTENEFLLLHTITWSIYSLTFNEYENILNNETLLSNRVIIPSNLNEDDIAQKVYLKRVTKPELPTYEFINGYVILTTTSCNARCFYCYEENLNKTETMTTETAENLVQFMIKHRNINKPLHIQWFGGEPLLNQRIIDYIVNRLIELEIPYTTSIISNAFLLNKETVEKLERWNLKKIQITLDGIKDDYNKAKNYVYSDIDAYLTVIENIHNLLEKSNTEVTIRINANTDNIDHLHNDILLLKDEFKDYLNKKLSIYVAPLFGYLDESYEPINNFWEKLEALQDIVMVSPLNACDLSLNDGIFKRERIDGHCMAYAGTTVAVTPSGKIFPCEHIKDEDCLGDIFNGVTNTNVIEKWQFFDGEEINFCKETKCPYFPLCPKFYHCDTATLCSTIEQKNIRVNKGSYKLLRTKKFYDNKKLELLQKKEEKNLSKE